jgi:hypothetical protein
MSPQNLPSSSLFIILLTKSLFCAYNFAQCYNKLVLKLDLSLSASFKTLKHEKFRVSFGPSVVMGRVMAPSSNKLDLERKQIRSLNYFDVFNQYIIYIYIHTYTYISINTPYNYHYNYNYTHYPVVSAIFTFQL